MIRAKKEANWVLWWEIAYDGFKVEFGGRTGSVTVGWL